MGLIILLSVTGNFQHTYEPLHPKHLLLSLNNPLLVHFASSKPRGSQTRACMESPVRAGEGHTQVSGLSSEFLTQQV